MSSSLTSGNTGNYVASNVKWNNPLNIRQSSEKWQGKLANPSQKSFEEFETLEYGTRAGVKNLLTYYTVHKLDTLGKIISRWAPATENDTSNYVRFVATKMAIEPDDKIDLGNKNVMSELVSVMSIMEKGASQSVSANYVYGVIDKYNLM